MLNLTKEQVNNIVIETLTETKIVDLQNDWLTMHAELARLNKAIREAVGEIKSSIHSGYIEDGDEFCIGKKFAYSSSIDILRKHGLMEENNE